MRMSKKRVHLLPVIISGQPKQVSVQFRPVSVSVFQFSPVSVFRPKHNFRPKQPVSAEIPCFGQINLLRQHISFKKTMAETFFSTGITCFGRNSVFRPKFGFWPEFQLSARVLFRCFGRKTVSVDD